MIQPIKQSVSFKAGNQGMQKTPDIFKSVAQGTTQKTSGLNASAGKVEVKPDINAVSENQTDIKPKKSFRETVHGIKIGFMNIVKGFNNVKDTTSGFIKGVREGVTTAALVGTVGANLLKSKKSISESLKNKGVEAAEAAKNFPLGKLTFKTITGTVSDIAKTAGKVIKHIPDLYNKAPKDNLKTAVSLPGRFIKYMGNKKLIALSSVIAAGIIALRTLQGKISANRANANIDHSLNEGHIALK